MLLPTPTPVPDIFSSDSFFRGIGLAFSAIPLWLWMPLIALGALRVAVWVRERREKKKDADAVRDDREEVNHEDTEGAER